MAQLGGLVVSLEANMAKFQSDMGRSAAVTEQAMRKMDASSIRTEQALTRLNTTVSTVKNSIAGLAAGVIGNLGVSQVVRLADEYTKFTAQLRLATDSQAEYAQAYADVQRIAKASQADLAGTGVLYARIASGGKELGIAQRQIADVTETVNLALKVSGATAAESASAQLQLAQAFASGALRGEEFNAVNEAAPRLMKALADGIGAPVGALKEMAANGELTSAVLVNALPKALNDLRKEAVAVQTISGAFIELKNEVLEFVGTEAQASGAVQAMTTGIGALSNNLGLLTGLVTTLGASKLAQWTAAASVEAYKAAAAKQAQAVSTLAAAKADVTATASAVALANARVSELRASVLAAEGAVALAVATNGLIPAQTKAAAASAAHTAALAAQAVAQRSVSMTAGLAQGALGLLGGPIGAITTLLGLGATAWMVWGNSAKDSEAKAATAIEASTEEIIANLDQQIKKLRERNGLAAGGLNGIAKSGSAEAERMASLRARMDAASAGTGEFAGLGESARNDVLAKLGAQYGTLYAKIQEVNVEKTKLESTGNASKLDEWLGKYATKAEKLAAELKKAKEEFGGILPPEVEKRIRDSFAEKPNKGDESKARRANEAAKKAAEEARKEMNDGWVLMIDQQIDEDKRKADAVESHFAKIKKASDEAAAESQKAWDNFGVNVQRNLGDGLYNAMKGNFDNIGDAFLDMLLRMATDAAAANITKAMFSGGETGQGWVGSVIKFGAGLMSGGTTASAANGYDIPSGVNPVTQLHEREMVLPREHADVIRSLANGGGSSGKSVSVSVAVDAKGSKVEGNDQQSGQLGQMIGSAVRGVLMQEMRPGGMLA